MGPPPAGCSPNRLPGEREAGLYGERERGREGSTTARLYSAP